MFALDAGKVFTLASARVFLFRGNFPKTQNRYFSTIEPAAFIQHDGYMTTTQTTTTHHVAAEVKAHIEGASRYGSLYIFGTVEAYAAKYNEDPAEAVAKATKLGHELAWASPESAVIVDRKTYPGHYAAMQDERAAALQLKIGDRVELEGRVYILANAPNHNVALKPVAA